MAHSENPEKKKISIHSMEHLMNYDLFHKPLNTIIQTAFIINENRFEITLKQKFKLGKNDISLFYYDYNKTDSSGNFILITCKNPSFRQQENKLIVEPACLDFSKNYLIEILDDRSCLFLDPAIGGILDTQFNADKINDLGVKLKGNTAIFKVWSPPAGKIIIKIFDANQQPVITTSELSMRRGENGLWAFELVCSDLVSTTSLDGLFYQYEVYAYGEIKIALDPYAKSMAAFDPDGDDSIGKGAIINFDKIPSAKNNYKNADFMSNETDLIAYEIHVRDFTIQPNVVNEEVAGTFKGFINKIDYLKKLGITHVQLLPIQNFYSVNETDRSYKGADASQSNYNWGYDPHNYFTPEGIFSTNPFNPYSRIYEFRELIQALHDNGIGIIMDVVYNHTYVLEIFENIAPGCYYRYDNNLKISGTTGAGPTLESRRQMVRKLILDSLKHFVAFYNIDGFRFDLMGFLDHKTMETIRQEAGATYNKNNPNELILHGEAWIFSDINTDTKIKGEHAATTKINYPGTLLNLGIFNDTSRDSYAGKEQNKGYIHGIISEADRVATGITGGLINYNPGSVFFNSPRFSDSYNSFAGSPENCLNYLTIHDGYTLWDKLNLSIKDPSKKLRAQIMRMANAMLFTSQGKIILHGGDELLRIKPLALSDKEKNRAHTSEFVTEEEGVLYFHENTYCSNDFTNMIRWDRLTNEYADISNTMIDYYKGLIEMRRNIPALRFRKAESIKNGLVFLKNESPDSVPFIAFTVDNSLEKDIAKELKGTNFTRLIIIYNANEIDVTLNNYFIDNPDQWCVIADDYNAGISPLTYTNEPLRSKGTTTVLIKNGSVTVPAKTVAVIAK